ncbi:MULTISPECIES: hypothetical protein [unclassified Haematospirillum]|nr:MULTISPECIES: hypothetical protein [unclassified Haematospirillum]NKD55164.1 hypothetical protein [Haematospirillum sp. H4890]NKD75417.1 hypothetical protein [Haematospirillum sp. H4485]NKD75592.1 hypothetical protein [Haematospirillum sp. H4485]
MQVDQIVPRLAAVEARLDSTDRTLAEVALTQREISRTLTALTVQEVALDRLGQESVRMWEKISAAESSLTRIQAEARIAACIGSSCLTGAVAYIIWLMQHVRL